MKSLQRFLRFAFLLPVCLLLATTCLCFAKTAQIHLTKEEAKEIGIEIRSKSTDGNTVRVEFGFKEVGKLKGYSSVELETRDGHKSRSATLHPENAEGGRFVTSFTADLTKLDKLSVLIRVPAGMNSYHYILPLKNFLEQASVPKPITPASVTPK